MTKSPHLVEPGKKVNLDKWTTEENGEFADKAAGLAAADKLRLRLKELQGVLYAESKRALLVVIQAMDAGGKDGAVEYVFSGVNPQGCSAISFKVPTEEELGHDYLWRIHKAAPRRGMIGIFNRSHYESVLVERVKSLCPKKIWSRRYDHINQFEQMLADEGTVIRKFFLHISKKEQKKRFEDRIADPTKNWKFNPNDLKERLLWDDYMAAYEDALTKCSTPDAPWYVVPADNKWYRNWVISDVLVRTLEDMDLKYPPPVAELANLKVV